MNERGPLIVHNKAKISISIAPDQVATLDSLAEQRRVSRSVLVREAIDLFVRVNMPSGSRPVGIDRVAS